MSAAISESSSIGAGWTVHDQVIRAVNTERAHAEEWSDRTASRVRTFVPEPVHVPRHRAETPAERLASAVSGG